MLQAFSWDEMLRMFRLLGGTADNIMPAGGDDRGLKPVDQQKPVELRVPPNLCFRTEDVAFADGHLRLKQSANAGDAERLFFDRYQMGVSWDGGGRSQAVSFVNQIDNLPSDVRSFLGDEFGFQDLMEGDALERAQKWFLKSRSLQLGESACLVPLIELANPGSGGLPLYGDGGQFTVEGTVKDEIRIAHEAHDSFGSFRTFGLIRREPGAFSLPMDVQFPDRRISIFQHTGSHMGDGKGWIPPLVFENGIGTLPFVLIGHRRMPRQPRGMFRTAVAEAHIEKPDEVFDTILQFNWARFLNLLSMLEPHEGKPVEVLRTVVRYQLEAVSHCIGSVESATPQPAKEPAKEEVWSLSIS